MHPLDRRAFCAAVAVASSLASPLAAQSPPRAVQADWSLEIALDLGAGTAIHGCAMGDFDPRHDGAEIGVVAAGGRVLAVRSTPQGYAHELVAELPGEPLACAVGDCRPEFPGRELVTVGTARGASGVAHGTYHVFARVDGAWQQVESGTRPAAIRAVAIGDLLPAPGDELVFGGAYGHGDIGLMTSIGRAFVAGAAMPLPGVARDAGVGLGGAFFACDDGTLQFFGATDGGLRAQDFGDWDDGLTRLAVDAHGVLVCSDDGELRFRQSRSGGGYSSTARVSQSDQPLRGAVIADVDPTAPGDEFATAGLDGRIRVARVKDMDPARIGRRMPVDPPIRMFATGDFVVAESKGRLNHLEAGSLPGRGVVLVGVDSVGCVLVVRHVSVD